MTSKLLRGIGIAALIALVLGSIAALAVVQSRLDITIAEATPSAGRGPDPVTLLASDVALMHEDLRALGDGVGAQMQALHDGLAGAAAEREANLDSELAELRRGLAKLQERLERDSADLGSARAELLRSLEQLERRLLVVGTTASADPTEAVAGEPTIADAPEVAPGPAASVESASEAIPAERSVPKKGFLSFQLPSRGFAFDQPQRFAIVPSLSRVGFDAKSTLHDFSGVTTALEGAFTANLARPATGCSGTVIARASTLDTGLAARDESMREILEPREFPELRFDWSAFDPTSVDAAAQKVVGVAKGKLTIHGVSRDIAMPVTVAVDGSKRLAIDGQAKIKLSDYGVKPPSKLGLISVEDEAVLWIALRARTLGPAAVETH